MNTIRVLALATSLATFVLLLAGATVSATGAGLACPDWPLCQGRLIPPFERLVLIEYSHRLLASAVGLMMLALAVLVWRRPAPRPRFVPLAVVLLVLLGAQVALGGVTVLSALKPIVVGTHLATAMLFLALLVALTARAYWEGGAPLEPDAAGGRSGSPLTGLRRLVHLAVALVFLQIAVGGFVSAFGAGLACPDFPLCDGRLLPSARPVVVVHVFHRLLAFAVVVVLAALAGKARASRDRFVRSAAAAAVLLVIVQVVLGALNVLTRLDAAVRVAHLGGAAALLATLAALMVRVRVVAIKDPRAIPRQAPREVVPAGSGGIARALDYLALTKPRIIVLLLITTITTMVVAAGGAGFTAALAAYTLLGGALAAGAANAINCYWDRDIDAVMRRTRSRPLPAGRVTPGRALVFGVGLGAISVVVLGWAVNWLSALLALSGILFYVGVYTIWLKRSTPQNIVIGGAAGAIPPLVGWAAVTNQVGLPAVLLFAIIFLWTPPHFWALALNREEDYRAAGVPMLPVVRGTAETLRQMGLYTLALVTATLWLAAIGVLGRLYLIAAVALAIPLLALMAQLARQTTARTARVLFGYSIAYLGLLFAAMALDRLLAG
jgi:protoheme IX farnesyltransferase